jgi:hypothetical protein
VQCKGSFSSGGDGEGQEAPQEGGLFLPEPSHVGETLRAPPGTTTRPATKSRRAGKPLYLAADGSALLLK